MLSFTLLQLKWRLFLLQRAASCSKAYSNMRVISVVDKVPRVRLYLQPINATLRICRIWWTSYQLSAVYDVHIWKRENLESQHGCVVLINLENYAEETSCSVNGLKTRPQLFYFLALAITNVSSPPTAFPINVTADDKSGHLCHQDGVEVRHADWRWKRCL